MAATGNEVPTLDQLLMYVKYASDEDIDSYLRPSITPGNFNVAQPSEGNLDGINVSNITANADADGTITISGYFDTFYDTGINYGTPAFEIPTEYAPNENVTFYIRDLSYDQDYLFELDTEGIAQYVGSEIMYIYQSHRYAIASTITYNIGPLSSITGKEVVRLSQIKAFLDSGGSSEPTWTTIFEGNYTCSNTGALEINEDTSGCSKLRITAKYVQYSYEHDSGTFEFDNVDFNSQYAHTIGTFELYDRTFTVQMMLASTGLNINVTCNTSSYTAFCRITKVEAM